MEIEEHKNQGCSKREFQPVLFQRTISFPKPIDEANVTARHRDGILTLHLPKIGGIAVEIRLDMNKSRLKKVAGSLVSLLFPLFTIYALKKPPTPLTIEDT